MGYFIVLRWYASQCRTGFIALHCNKFLSLTSALPWFFFQPVQRAALPYLGFPCLSRGLPCPTLVFPACPEGCPTLVFSACPEGCPTLVFPACPEGCPTLVFPACAEGCPTLVFPACPEGCPTLVFPACPEGCPTLGFPACPEGCPTLVFPACPEDCPALPWFCRVLPYHPCLTIPPVPCRPYLAIPRFAWSWTAVAVLCCLASESGQKRVHQ